MAEMGSVHPPLNSTSFQTKVITSEQASVALGMGIWLKF